MLTSSFTFALARGHDFIRITYLTNRKVRASEHFFLLFSLPESTSDIFTESKKKNYNEGNVEKRVTS